MRATDTGAVVVTSRLTVRPWQPEEAERLFDIRRRSEVARWLGDPTPWTSVNTAVEHVARWTTEIAADPPLGVWAIVPNDDAHPAGSVSLHRLPDDDEIEIGWHLHPDAAGRGLAREAARGLLDHALAHGPPRVWAIMWPHNGASARVAAAIGMRDLGVRHDPWYGTDHEPTSRMFRIDATAPHAG